MRRFVTAITLTLLTISLAACLDREVSKIDFDDPSKEDSGSFPVLVNNDLDILFVIDDSGSMAAEQTSLRVNFERLIEQIKTIEHGLPNLHIGVVSTDIGIGPEYADTELAQGGRCSAEGDGGLLRGESCLSSGQRFIVDLVGDGAARSTNYDGELEAAFSCIAELGTQGCGFEQPLEAMQRALDATVTPENDGFLREHARLAVVFITDEDDCSASNPELFNPSASALGEWRSGYRCFEYGVTCDVDDPRTAGEHENCRPKDDSPLLHDIERYIAFVRQLKRDPERDILIAGIVGDNAEPVIIDEVTRDGHEMLAVRKSCGEIDGQSNDGAFPPVRLRAFFEAFGFHQQTSICEEDLSDALRQLGEFMRPPLTHDCLPDPLLDTDEAQNGWQPECVISEVRLGPNQSRDERPLSACNDFDNPRASSQLPCYTMLPDASQCSDTQHQLVVQAHYDVDQSAPPGTFVEWRCAVR